MRLFLLTSYFQSFSFLELIDVAFIAHFDPYFVEFVSTQCVFPMYLEDILDCPHLPAVRKDSFCTRACGGLVKESSSHRTALI